MPALRLALAIVLLSTSLAARASEDADAEWATFGRIVALVQPLLRLALTSDDPRAVEREMDRVVAGQHPEANRLAAELHDEALAGMPPEMKASLGALARDVVTFARRERQRAIERGDHTHGARGEPGGAQRAIQARSDLNAIGLRYYDPVEFLEAVKRNDTLAVELFLAGRGIDPSARGDDGANAFELARRLGHRDVTALLERAAPAPR